VLAVVLGIVLTILPLITLVEVRLQSSQSENLPLSRQLKDLDGVSEGTPADSNLDLTVLAIAFAIAAVIYLINKRRLSSRDQEYARFNPY